MAEPIEIPSADLDLDLDLDSFFDSIPKDFSFDFDADFFDRLPPVDDPLPLESGMTYESPGFIPLGSEGTVNSSLEPEPPVLGSNTDSMSSWVFELEQMLMEEGGEAEDAKVAHFGDFFADVFADVSDGGSVKSVVSDGDGDGTSVSRDASSPGSNTEEADEEEKENANDDGSEGKSADDDEDPIAKKRRRQLRNRDSAMKSRERKKLYIQDLEKKSKFLDMECRRLENLLRCCAAENVALHHRILGDRISGATSAKQESAVLFVESLLLGSLFWLVNIVFLFLAPGLLARSLELPAVTEKARGQERHPNQGVMGAKSSRNRSLNPGLDLEMIFTRRRYKALRTKIKNFPISPVIFSPQLVPCM